MNAMCRHIFVGCQNHLFSIVDFFVIIKGIGNLIAVFILQDLGIVDIEETLTFWLGENSSIGMLLWSFPKLKKKSK